MQRTIKYIGWLIETKNHKTTTTTKIGKNKPKTERHKTKRKPKTEKHYQETETSEHKSQNGNIKHPKPETHKKVQKLNHKTETESENTNHSHKRRKQKQENSLKPISRVTLPVRKMQQFRIDWGHGA